MPAGLCSHLAVRSRCHLVGGFYPASRRLNLRAWGHSRAGLRPAASAGDSRAARGETEGKVAPRAARPAATLSLGLGPQPDCVPALLGTRMNLSIIVPVLNEAAIVAE